MSFLLRELSIHAIPHSFTFAAVHIPGARNTQANLLSRLKFQEFAALDSAQHNATSSDCTALDGQWRSLLEDSWSANTRRTYSSVQNKFESFCSIHNLIHPNGSPLPASELTLLSFIAFASKSCQASSLKVYLAAIRALHIQQGFKDPLSDCLRIPLVVRGLRRCPKVAKVPDKLPITTLTLQAIKFQLDFTNYDDVMFWAACCTAFFGFLRTSEFTAQGVVFSPEVPLSIASIVHPVPNSVSIRLSQSKTDQFGVGATIILARADSPLCPLAALMSYLPP